MELGMEKTRRKEALIVLIQLLGSLGLDPWTASGEPGFGSGSPDFYRPDQGQLLPVDSR